MTRAPLAALAVALASGFAAAAPAARVARNSSAARFKAMIGRTFTQESVANMERNKDSGYRFETFDPQAGYARVVGPFDGRDDFFRLPGKAGDVLLMVEYSCGPDCTQKISAYRFAADGTSAHVPFKDLLAISAFDELRRRLVTLCLDSGGDFDTERANRAPDAQALPVCPLAIALSKTGNRARLYHVADEDGSGYSLSVAKTRLTPKAFLTWNGKSFLASDPGDEPGVFLNGDQMRRLF
jgi:hypothetical protein